MCGEVVAHRIGLLRDPGLLSPARNPLPATISSELLPWASLQVLSTEYTLLQSRHGEDPPQVRSLKTWAVACIQALIEGRGDSEVPNAAL